MFSVLLNLQWSFYQTYFWYIEPVILFNKFRHHKISIFGKFLESGATKPSSNYCLPIFHLKTGTIYEITEELGINTDDLSIYIWYVLRHDAVSQSQTVFNYFEIKKTTLSFTNFFSCKKSFEISNFWLIPLRSATFHLK